MSRNFKVYLVTPDGNDTNDGSEVAPFASLGAAASRMQPGDRCLVRAGMYRETLRPAMSGMDSAPMIFEAYEDETPVISGCELVSEWEHVEGAIYKANLGFFTEQVFLDGKMLQEARFPKNDGTLMQPTFLLAEEGSDPNHLVSSAITQPDGYWEGALLWVQCFAKADTAVVKKHVGNTLEFDDMNITKINRMANEGHPKEAFAPSGPKDEWYGRASPFFLLRGPREILGENEWWLDPTTHELYVWLPGGVNPAAHTVEAKARTYAINLTERCYVKIHGFGVHGASATMPGSGHNEISDCHFRYVSHTMPIHHTAEFWCEWNGGVFDTGIELDGTDNTLRDCTILYSHGNGIGFGRYSFGCKVLNCYVSHVNYHGLDCAAINGYGRRHIIRHNTLRHTGDSVMIYRHMIESEIMYNDFSHAGYINRDIGVTYTHEDCKATTLAYNYIHDNPHNIDQLDPNKHNPFDGLYLDNLTKGVRAHHNVIWRVAGAGIRMNVPQCDVTIANNTVFDCGKSLDWFGFMDWIKMEAKIVNNLFTDGVGGQNQQTGYLHNEYGEGAEAHHNLQMGRDPMLMNPFEGDFRPRPGSPAEAAGETIPGITRLKFRDAPEIGAYILGADEWCAGANLTKRGEAQCGGPLEPTRYTPWKGIEEAETTEARAATAQW